MRTTAATLLMGCLVAAPAATRAQTSILPPAATLVPHQDGVGPRGEAACGPTFLAEHSRRGEGRPPRGRTCFNQAEAREILVMHRLIDPVRALRVGRQQGDALSARLCRWEPEEYVYEINVLRRDGRILHLFLNARSGEAVSTASQAVQAGGRPPEKER